MVVPDSVTDSPVANPSSPQPPAQPVTISSTTAANLLVSTTTSHHILPTCDTTVTPTDLQLGLLDQHTLTKSTISLVHTDCDTIRQALMTNLDGLMNNTMNNTMNITMNNTMNNTMNKTVNTTINTTTTRTTSSCNTVFFSFATLLTVDKSASGRPVKKRVNFDIQLHQVSENELSFTTVPTSETDPPTDPSDPSDPTDPTTATSSIEDSVNKAIISGAIIITPQSLDAYGATTLVTLTASIPIALPTRRPSGATTPLSLSRRLSGTPLSTSHRLSKNGLEGASKNTVPGNKSDPSPATPSPATAATGAAILSHVVNAVRELHTHYARYDQVDAAMLTKFEKDTVPNAPAIKPHEDALVNRSLLFGDDEKAETKFKRIKVSETRSDNLTLAKRHKSTSAHSHTRQMHTHVPHTCHPRATHVPPTCHTRATHVPYTCHTRATQPLLTWAPPSFTCVRGALNALSANQRS